MAARIIDAARLLVWRADGPCIARMRVAYFARSMASAAAAAALPRASLKASMKAEFQVAHLLQQELGTLPSGLRDFSAHLTVSGMVTEALLAAEKYPFAAALPLHVIRRNIEWQPAKRHHYEKLESGLLLQAAAQAVAGLPPELVASEVVQRGLWLLLRECCHLMVYGHNLAQRRLLLQAGSAAAACINSLAVAPAVHAAPGTLAACAALLPDALPDLPCEPSVVDAVLARIWASFDLAVPVQAAASLPPRSLAAPSGERDEEGGPAAGIGRLEQLNYVALADLAHGLSRYRELHPPPLAAATSPRAGASPRTGAAAAAAAHGVTTDVDSGVLGVDDSRAIDSGRRVVTLATVRLRQRGADPLPAGVGSTTTSLRGASASQGLPQADPLRHLHAHASGASTPAADAAAAAGPTRFAARARSSAATAVSSLDVDSLNPHALLTLLLATQRLPLRAGEQRAAWDAALAACRDLPQGVLHVDHRLLSSFLTALASPTCAIPPEHKQQWLRLTAAPGTHDAGARAAALQMAAPQADAAHDDAFEEDVSLLGSGEPGDAAALADSSAAVARQVQDAPSADRARVLAGAAAILHGNVAAFGRLVDEWHSQASIFRYFGFRQLLFAGASITRAHFTCGLASHALWQAVSTVLSSAGRILKDDPLLHADFVHVLDGLLCAAHASAVAPALVFRRLLVIVRDAIAADAALAAEIPRDMWARWLFIFSHHCSAAAMPPTAAAAFATVFDVGRRQVWTAPVEGDSQVLAHLLSAYLSGSNPSKQAIASELVLIARQLTTPTAPHFHSSDPLVRVAVDTVLQIDAALRDGHAPVTSPASGSDTASAAAAEIGPLFSHDPQSCPLCQLHPDARTAWMADAAARAHLLAERAALQLAARGSHHGAMLPAGGLAVRVMRRLVRNYGKERGWESATERFTLPSGLFMDFAWPSRKVFVEKGSVWHLASPAEQPRARKASSAADAADTSRTIPGGLFARAAVETGRTTPLVDGSGPGPWLVPRHPRYMPVPQLRPLAFDSQPQMAAVAMPVPDSFDSAAPTSLSAAALARFQVLAHSGWRCIVLLRRHIADDQLQSLLKRPVRAPDRPDAIPAPDWPQIVHAVDDAVASTPSSHAASSKRDRAATGMPDEFTHRKAAPRTATRVASTAAEDPLAAAHGAATPHEGAGWKARKRAIAQQRHQLRAAQQKRQAQQQVHEAEVTSHPLVMW